MSNTRTLIFQVPHKVGALKEALNIFQKHAVNLTKIDSKPSKVRIPTNISTESNRVYDFVVDVADDVSAQSVESAINELVDTKACATVTRVGSQRGNILKILKP